MVVGASRMKGLSPGAKANDYYSIEKKAQGSSPGTLPLI